MVWLHLCFLVSNNCCNHDPFKEYLLMLYVHIAITQLIVDSQISWTVFPDLIAFLGILKLTSHEYILQMCIRFKLACSVFRCWATENIKCFANFVVSLPTLLSKRASPNLNVEFMPTGDNCHPLYKFQNIQMRICVLGKWPFETNLVCLDKKK